MYSLIRNEDDLITMGRMALASPHWRWITGAVDTMGRVNVQGRWFVTDGLQPHNDGPECVPDLNQPATRGCLLQLVREIRGEAATVELDIGGWRSKDTFRGKKSIALGVYDMPTEAHALLAALRAGDTK